MPKICKNFNIVDVVTALIFVLTGLLLLPYGQQPHFPFSAEAGEVACIDYDEEETPLPSTATLLF